MSHYLYAFDENCLILKLMKAIVSKDEDISSNDVTIEDLEDMLQFYTGINYRIGGNIFEEYKIHEKEYEETGECKITIKYYLRKPIKNNQTVNFTFSLKNGTATGIDFIFAYLKEDARYLYSYINTKYERKKEYEIHKKEEKQKIQCIKDMISEYNKKCEDAGLSSSAFIQESFYIDSDISFTLDKTFAEIKERFDNVNKDILNYKKSSELSHKALKLAEEFKSLLKSHGIHSNKYPISLSFSRYSYDEDNIKNIERCIENLQNLINNIDQICKDIDQVQSLKKYIQERSEYYNNIAEQYSPDIKKICYTRILKSKSIDDLLKYTTKINDKLDELPNLIKECENKKKEHDSLEGLWEYLDIKYEEYVNTCKKYYYKIAIKHWDPRKVTDMESAMDYLQKISDASNKITFQNFTSEYLRESKSFKRDAAKKPKDEDNIKIKKYHHNLSDIDISYISSPSPEHEYSLIIDQYDTNIIDYEGYSYGSDDYYNAYEYN